MSFDENYLSSSNFKNLCLALDFLTEDIEEIRVKVSNLNDKSNLEESIALIIHEQMLKYKDTPSRQIADKVKYFRWLSNDDILFKDKYYYQVLIRDESRWDAIKSKMKMGLRSEKINSDYLFEKEFYRELDSIDCSEVENALNLIYLHEIHYLLKKFHIHEDNFKMFFWDACLDGYYANPLLFDDVEREFEKSLESVPKMPLLKIRDCNYLSLMNIFAVIENEKLAKYVCGIFKKSNDDYPTNLSNQLLVYSPTIFGDTIFYVIGLGTSDGFVPRSDSDIICMKKELVKNSYIMILNQDSQLRAQFEDFIDDDFTKSYQKVLAWENEALDGFDVWAGEFDGKSFRLLDCLKGNYNPNDLLEIASQIPLCDEFLGLVSSLGLTIDDALKIQKSEDTCQCLNQMISPSKENLDNEKLQNELEMLYPKSILVLKYDRWDEIKKNLQSKIDSGKVKSAYDLHVEFDDLTDSTLKANILYAQITAMIDFKEADFKNAQNLAFYLQDKDILDNGLAGHLNELTKPREIRQKTYLDEGKFPAPRWLVYPELDARTIGWRMGYGECYAMNAPMVPLDLFPKPRNWLFNAGKSNLKSIPLLGYLWTPDGRPKYSKISDDAVVVNDFITVEKADSKFQYNSFMLKSIENGILLSKYTLFGKVHDTHKVSMNTLKRGFELTDDENSYWQKVKYSVLLNASYYKFMQDENLKRKLLGTGNKPLVYLSDDEWGGKDNLFGFALMELRDEIRRLYENENLIDWQYTEYLKHKNPYENPQKRDPNDEQSHEYMIVLSTVDSSEAYVRDVNLDEGLSNRYEVGQTITERAFVDATNRIGGIKTTHRYLILSNQMKDLSAFEKDMNWGLHVTKPESKFKVLDIYKKDGKTQILLLQLPEGFERVFVMENNIIKQAIESSRELFEECLEKDPIAEVTTPEWLERVSFPLGIDSEGNFF